MNTFIIFLAGLLAVTRIAYIFLGRRTLNHDTYRYLIFAEDIRRKITGKKKLKRLNSDTCDSPLLFPAILSFVPRKVVQKAANLLPVAFELLNFFILYYFLTFLNTPNKFYLLTLFIFYPLYTSLYPGPRSYNPTPRLMSEALMNLSFLLLFLYVTSNNLIFLLAAYFAGGLVVLTNKFGLQVILFFILPLSIFLKSPALFLFPFITVALALLLGGKRFFLSLKNQAGHLRYYFKEMQYTHPIILARSKNKLKVLKEEGVKQFFASVLMESDAFNFFIKNYLGVITLLLILTIGNTLPLFFLVWFVVSLIIYGLTTTKHLRFLGEAERYLFYSGIALFVLLSQFNLSKTIYLLLILFELIYFAAMGIAIYLIEKYKKDIWFKESHDEVVAFIKKKDYDDILPIKLAAPWEFVYDTQKKFCGFRDIWNHPEFYRKIWLPIKSLEKLRKKYGFKTIIVDKRYEEPYKKALEKYRKVFENEHYQVYRV